MNSKLMISVVNVSNPALQFDTSGKPYNAAPGSPESFMSLGQAFLTSAIARGAIAPQWEVQTAAMQAQAGDPLAGLTEEARSTDCDAANDAVFEMRGVA